MEIDNQISCKNDDLDSSAVTSDSSRKLLITSVTFFSVSFVAELNISFLSFLGYIYSIKMQTITTKPPYIISVSSAELIWVLIQLIYLFIPLVVFIAFYLIVLHSYHPIHWKISIFSTILGALVGNLTGSIALFLLFLFQPIEPLGLLQSFVVEGDWIALSLSALCGALAGDRKLFNKRPHTSE